MTTQVLLPPSALTTTIHYWYFTLKFVSERNQVLCFSPSYINLQFDCHQFITLSARLLLTFHDADTDTDTDSDSTDTSIHPYVRYARFPREDPREEVRVGVSVGAVECQLYNT